MITAWLWLRTYWYAPLVLLGGAMALVAWWLTPRGRRATDPLGGVAQEFRALAAEHQVRELQAQQGLQVAQQAVTKKYQSQIEALDSQEMARVEQLRQNPAAMAKAIERLTKP